MNLRVRAVRAGVGGQVFDAVLAILGALERLLHALTLMDLEQGELPFALDVVARHLELVNLARARERDGQTLCLLAPVRVTELQRELVRAEDAGAGALEPEPPPALAMTGEDLPVHVERDRGDRGR